MTNNSTEQDSKLLEEQILQNSNYSEQDQLLFKKAIELAKKTLADKKRLAGDSFFDHNLRVANYLQSIKSAPEVVAAGLVHAIIKYIPERELHDFFKERGKDILALVKGVEEITVIKNKNLKLTAEALRKILLTTIKDARIILIKLADKLDNLADVTVLSVDEQQRICQEILDMYAPLAYRLGVEKFKIQLEDLALKVLNPEEFNNISKFLEHSKQERDELISLLIQEIKTKLKSVDLKSVKGRSKHVYSIHKKIAERGVALEDHYDHLAIRIIVENERECYEVLGFLHEFHEILESRLKDYIANPKPNGYQSIHTGILFNNKRVEVQIRTQQMDEFAEEGLAAHWRYKGGKGEADFERRMGWLKGVLDLNQDSTAREFLEHVNVDLFTDEIYCYTPKGEVRYYPKGAGVLDFAYSIHEKVGSCAIGARVNGQFLPLRTKLKSGDVIEIITAKNQVPGRGWLKWVKSPRAKQKIRKALKEHKGLPAMRYSKFKPVIQTEYDTLVHSLKYENAACVLAKCCQPIPPQKIVGIVTKKRLISIHEVECRQAIKVQDRWETVEWKEQFNKALQFHVIAVERSGLLADLLHTIANAKFEVREAKAKVEGTGRNQCSFVIIPQSLNRIVELIDRVRKVKGVKKIFFE
ncbi:bifunctional (p)ppGpp synthetase/guanosine-3',5'-bis(diphosphate) 3'-pyrophosphohydrolase [archaeon]|jgi:GTP diphosphokinase / guanosine-3',5'-bis(diphosphate) 3'-diphosphatase|nr:bifunctional (p)ppGpp synthetase/guanosine-3',5'-bis(diphosphate) 3'-pyrophosphohydrolase [archaeon]